MRGVSLSIVQMISPPIYIIETLLKFSSKLALLNFKLMTEKWGLSVAETFNLKLLSQLYVPHHWSLLNETRSAN